MPGQATVTVDGKQWAVAVANTLVELTSGLSGVGSIPSQTGILFDLGYDYSTIQIDMSRMLFPLDIIFINSTRGVVGVMHNVQPGETDVRFENVNLAGARWFLEVNAAEAEGISVGDNVAIQCNVAPAQLDLTSLFNFALTFMIVVFMGKMAIRAVSPPKPKPELYGPSGERLLPQTKKYLTILDSGGTIFQEGDVVSPEAYERENQRVKKLGLKPAFGKHLADILPPRAPQTEPYTGPYHYHIHIPVTYRQASTSAGRRYIRQRMSEVRRRILEQCPDAEIKSGFVIGTLDVKCSKPLTARDLGRGIEVTSWASTKLGRAN